VCKHTTHIVTDAWGTAGGTGRRRGSRLVGGWVGERVGGWVGGCSPECEGVYQYQLVIRDTLLIMELTRVREAVGGCFVNVRVCCEAQGHLS
jgi:hypothetical protein